MDHSDTGTNMSTYNLRILLGLAAIFLAVTTGKPLDEHSNAKTSGQSTDASTSCGGIVGFFHVCPTNTTTNTSQRSVKPDGKSIKTRREADQDDGWSTEQSAPDTSEEASDENQVTEETVMRREVANEESKKTQRDVGDEDPEQESGIESDEDNVILRRDVPPLGGSSPTDSKTKRDLDYTYGDSLSDINIYHRKKRDADDDDSGSNSDDADDNDDCPDSDNGSDDDDNTRRKREADDDKEKTLKSEADDNKDKKAKREADDNKDKKAKREADDNKDKKAKREADDNKDKKTKREADDNKDKKAKREADDNKDKKAKREADDDKEKTLKSEADDNKDKKAKREADDNKDKKAKREADDNKDKKAKREADNDKKKKTKRDIPPLGGSSPSDVGNDDSSDDSPDSVESLAKRDTRADLELESNSSQVLGGSDKTTKEKRDVPPLGAKTPDAAASSDLKQKQGENIPKTDTILRKRSTMSRSMPTAAKSKRAIIERDGKIIIRGGFEGLDAFQIMERTPVIFGN